MRHPTLRRGTFALLGLRAFPASDDKQGNSADESQPAEDWRNGNSIMLIRGGVDRSDIKNSFLMRIVETAIGEGQSAQNYQDNSQPDDRFHFNRSLSRPTAAGPESS